MKTLSRTVLLLALVLPLSAGCHIAIGDGDPRGFASQVLPVPPGTDWRITCSNTCLALLLGDGGGA